MNSVAVLGLSSLALAGLVVYMLTRTELCRFACLGRLLRTIEYFAVDAALRTGLGRVTEPILVMDDFLSTADLQPLLAQLPSNPTEHLYTSMKNGTARKNAGKGVSLEIEVQPALMQKLRDKMFKGGDGTAEKATLPVLHMPG